MRVCAWRAGGGPLHHNPILHQCCSSGTGVFLRGRELFRCRGMLRSPTLDQPLWKSLLTSTQHAHIHTHSHTNTLTGTDSLKLPASVLHPSSPLLSVPGLLSCPLSLCLLSPLRQPQLWLTQLFFYNSSQRDPGTCPPTWPPGTQPGAQGPKTSPCLPSGRGEACSTQLAQVSGGRLELQREDGLSILIL